MKLEIEYAQLANSIAILNKLKLGGLPSIHRTRLAKKLGEFLDRAATEQLEIQKEYYKLDENGEPIVDKDSCKDTEGYKKAMSELLKEKVVVDSGDSQVMLKSVKKSMEKSEVEFDGQEAFVFEYLYTALGGFDEDAENKEEIENESDYT